MINRGTRQTIPVPVHGSKPLRTGTLRAIIRDAGLTVEEFRRLLK
jgi:predicted RNA binding protein YcfA (HicA-like mRNA interferase family)